MKILQLEDITALCPTCRKWFFDPMNVTHIKETLECMRCEHVSGEVMDDHDCHADTGDDGCDNPVHGEDFV